MGGWVCRLEPLRPPLNLPRRPDPAAAPRLCRRRWRRMKPNGRCGGDARVKPEHDAIVMAVAPHLIPTGSDHAPWILPSRHGGRRPAIHDFAAASIVSRGWSAHVAGLDHA